MDAKPKFAVGDKVIVVIDAEDMHRYTDQLHAELDGQVGVITEIDVNPTHFPGMQWSARVEFDHLIFANPIHAGAKLWWLPTKHLMKVYPTE